MIQICHPNASMTGTGIERFVVRSGLIGLPISRPVTLEQLIALSWGPEKSRSPIVAPVKAGATKRTRIFRILKTVGLPRCRPCLNWGNDWYARCWCAGCELTNFEINTEYDRFGEGSCNTPCAGDSSTTCGGDNAFELHNTASCGKCALGIRTWNRPTVESRSRTRWGNFSRH